MLTLFDETKNPLFIMMCRLVDEINGGARLNRKQIMARITSMPTFQYNEAPEIDREREIVDAMFDFSSGFATLRLDAPLGTLIGSTELSWLKTMLMADEFSFLLPPDVRARLLARLKDVEPLYRADAWRKLRFQRSGEVPRGILYGSTLRLIVAALSERKKLRAADKILIPCRLEYDPFDDRYAAIVWDEQSDRAEKIFVERLIDLRLLDDNIPADVEERLQDFYRRHRTEISLQLNDTRNAVERCFAAFGSYDKRARLQDDGSYFLNVSCLDLDEQEVFDKIISLGAAVTVLAPEHFRRRVIERLRAIAQLYQH
ncbi:MAG: WYL domain-containing protein [Selenomonadaceae bacterium]|nr:WYL domain-containing protein [Selenomonadaceae bacterium]